MKAENKTQPTNKSITEFIQAIPEVDKRRDCQTLLDMMESVSGEKGIMWGESMIGFGIRHFVYASGREGDWFQVGFAPRKQNITLYLACGTSDFNDMLSRLGKHKGGKGCLYINHLSDVDQKVLRQIVERVVQEYY
jgi:hypothetical protein